MAVLRRELRTTLRDPVTRGWLVVTGGSVTRLAIGLIGSVLVARALGLAGLGVYAVLAALVSVLGAVADFGLTETAVLRVASSWMPRPDLAGERARGFFWTRVGLATAVGLAGLLVSLPLASRWGAVGRDGRLVALALAGVVATALSGAVSALLQATGRFGRLSLVMVANAVLTAVCAGGLALAGRLTVVSALAVLGAGTSLACFVLGARLLPVGLDLTFPGWHVVRREVRALLSFGVWIWIANSLAMLAAQLDLFVAGRWLAPAAVGVYALAVNLAAKAGVVNQSLHAALLPAASSLSGRREVRAFLRRGLLRSGLIALVLLPLVPLARWLIVTLYGGAFTAAAAIFPALLGVAIVDVFAAPVLLLAFPANRPRLIAAADALRVVAFLAVAALMVPRVGVFGLVWARLCASVAGVTVTAVVLGRVRFDGAVEPAASSASSGV